MSGTNCIRAINDTLPLLSFRKLRSSENPTLRHAFHLQFGFLGVVKEVGAVTISVNTYTQLVLPAACVPLELYATLSQSFVNHRNHVCF
ncbi:hypothetical protein ANCCAN_11027 [Ancylostoma caninum]|uniref:Uncharacterized protein n=1 Tax=Ancylostoma caninum TaxID=29170 RepID=A0A368GIB9_ANCCA|nr:hypothetical protein ANCCAN_11027 [Ancylostoma caninum]